MTATLANREHEASMSASSKSIQKTREAIDALCGAAATLEDLAVRHSPDTPAYPIGGHRVESMTQQHFDDDASRGTAADFIKLAPALKIDEAGRQRLEGFACFLRQFAGQHLRLISR